MIFIFNSNSLEDKKYMEHKNSTVLNSLLVGKIFKFTEIGSARKNKSPKEFLSSSTNPPKGSTFVSPFKNKLESQTSEINSNRNHLSPAFTANVSPKGQFTPFEDKLFKSNSFRKISTPQIENQITLESLKKEASRMISTPKNDSKISKFVKFDYGKQPVTQTKNTNRPEKEGYQLLDQIRRLNTYQTFDFPNISPYDAYIEDKRKQQKDPKAQYIEVYSNSKTIKRADLRSDHKRAANLDPSIKHKKDTNKQPKNEDGGSEFGARRMNVLPPTVITKDLGIVAADLEIFKNKDFIKEMQRRENLIRLRRSTSIEEVGHRFIRENHRNHSKRSMRHMPDELFEPGEHGLKKPPKQGIKPSLTFPENRRETQTSNISNRELQTNTYYDHKTIPTMKTQIGEEPAEKPELQVKCDHSGRYYLEIDQRAPLKGLKTRQMTNISSISNINSKCSKRDKRTGETKLDEEYYPTCLKIIDELKELKTIGCTDIKIRETLTRDCAPDSNIIKLLFDNEKLKVKELQDLLLLISHQTRESPISISNKILSSYNNIQTGTKSRNHYYKEANLKVSIKDMDRRREYRKQLALTDVKHEDILALPRILHRLNNLKLSLISTGIIDKVDKIFRCDSNKRTLKALVGENQTMYGNLTGSADYVEHMKAVKPLFALNRISKLDRRVEKMKIEMAINLEEEVEKVKDGKYKTIRPVVEKANEIIITCLHGKLPYQETETQLKVVEVFKEKNGDQDSSHSLLKEEQ